MGWIHKPVAHDAELEEAHRRLAKLEEAARRKALTMRLDARRRATK